MEREETARRVRQRLRTGELPREGEFLFWGGPGTGGPCQGCGEIVAASDRQVEVLFLVGEALVPRSFHMLCFALWEEERQQD